MIYQTIPMKFLVQMDVKNTMLQCLAMSHLFNKFAEDAVEKFDDDLSSGEAFKLGKHINFLKNCAGQTKNYVTVLLDVASEYNLIIPKSIFDKLYYQQYVSFYRGICGEVDYFDKQSIESINDTFFKIIDDNVIPLVRKYDIYNYYTFEDCGTDFSECDVHHRGLY